MFTKDSDTVHKYNGSVEYIWEVILEIILSD